jgi:hypothetical protein
MLRVTMGFFRLLSAPIRHIANSRLFQLAIIVAIILVLDHYSYDYAVLCSRYFGVGILTDPVLQVGLMIIFVYIVCLMIFYLLQITIRAVIDLVGSSNFLWLRSTIARERGISAYRAWLPLEKIRPAAIAQEDWEEMYAWPADNKPPYATLPRRILSAATSYLIVIVAVAVLLQIFTPFPVLTWLGSLIRIGSV